MGCRFCQASLFVISGLAALCRRDCTE